MMAGLLAGIRVLEVGQLVAGPYASALLAELGAEVIKVEPPEYGDASRGILAEGRPLLWWVENRDKKCVAIDLRDPAGKQVFLRLLATCDVLIENSRPGTFDRWGLSEVELRNTNPRLVIGKVSGYGQTGPYRDRACTDRQALAASGVTYLTGHPDAPPVRPGVPISDYVAGIHTALAVLAAVYGRDINGATPDTVDVALVDGMVRMTQGLVQEYLDTGLVRERTGNRNTSVPGEIFPSADGVWLMISVGTDRNWMRLAKAMDRYDLLAQPDLARNEGRRAREGELLRAIEEWTRTHSAARLETLLAESGVPCSRVQTGADLLDDPQLSHRGALVRVPTDTGEEVMMPAPVGRYRHHRQPQQRAGARLGADTFEVLTSLAGLDAREVGDLAARGVVAVADPPTLAQSSAEHNADSSRGT